MERIYQDISFISEDLDFLGFEELISADSVRCDGPLQQRTKFDLQIALNIDSQLSFQEVISLIFLTVENISTARKFCLEVENTEKNVVMTVNESRFSIMQCLYSSVRRVGGIKWPSSIFQALFHIGMKKLLNFDLGINIEEEEKELEEAGMIDEKKLMLYNFAENIESAEKEELIRGLQELHPPLKNAKMMETVLLQLLEEVKDIDTICPMLVTCLENMDNGLGLKKSLLERECGSKTCPMHALAKTEMYQKGPGICIIINQKIFRERNRDLEDRHGTDRDRDDLRVTFTLLGVEREDLMVYNDLTDTQMREKIEAVARLADARPDCAWVSVVILSHGRQRLGEDEVMGVNGEGLKKSDIMNAFSAKECPNLQKKPKLFWFQACRNKDSEAGGREARHEPEAGIRIAADNSVPAVGKLPALMNYMVGSATVPDASTFRSTEGGSFFIQSLCKVLKMYAEREPLSRVPERVTKEVTEYNSRYPSLPEFATTLTKEFWFQVTEESKERSIKLDKYLE